MPQQPRVRLGMVAERHDARSARRRGGLGELHELAIVAVEHGSAARLEAKEDFRLGVGDFLQRAEIFQMHRRDRRDDRHMRAHQFGQRRDLAGMVHADLEHRVFGARRTSGQRQRHAPMIVVGGGRGVRLAVGGEREQQRLLGRGLADRAGDGDDLGVRAGARGAREIALKRRARRRRSTAAHRRQSGRVCRARRPRARRRL